MRRCKLFLTIQNADCIYVLEKGQVIEQGTHQNLLLENGKYAELCKKSFLASDNAQIPAVEREFDHINV